MHTKAVRSALKLLALVLGLIAAIQVLTWRGADAQASFNAYQEAVLADGPSLFVTFDEGIGDVVAGLPTQFTGAGTPILDAETPLPSGQSLAVSSTGDFFGAAFEVPNTPATRAAVQTGETTIEVFFRGSDDTLGIVATNGGDFFFSGNPGLRAVQYDLGDFEAGGFDGSSSFEAFFDTAVTADVWYHLALVHDQITTAGPGGTPLVTSGELLVYVDGVRVATRTTDGTIPYDDTVSSVLSLALGQDRDGDYAVSPLFVDELAVYPRALTEAEIQVHVDAIDGVVVGNDPLGIGGSTSDPVLLSPFAVSGTETDAGLTFDHCAVNVESASVAACFALQSDLLSYLGSAGLPSGAGQADTNGSFDLLGVHDMSTGGSLAAVGTSCTSDLDVGGSFWEARVLTTLHGCPGIEYFSGAPGDAASERDFSNGVSEFETVGTAFDVVTFRYRPVSVPTPGVGTDLILTPATQTVRVQDALVSLRAEVIDSEASGPVRFAIVSGPNQEGTGVCQPSEGIFLGASGRACDKTSDGFAFWGFSNSGAGAGTSQIIAWEDANDDQELDDGEPRAFAQVVWIDEPLSAEQLGNRADSSHVSDPINTASGNFMMPGPSIGFGPEVYGMVFSSTYNSLDGGVTELGVGWSSSLDAQVRFVDGGVVEVEWVDGRLLRFVDDGTGTFAPPSAFNGELFLTADGGYRIDSYGGSSHLFNAGGQLVQMSNWDGQTVTRSYDDAGRVTAQSSSLGLSLSFSYVDGLLTTVTTSDGRSLDFTHDAGLVTSWSNPEGETTTFTYGDEGFIATMTDPTGVVQVDNTFDALGRVASQTVANGETSTFSYDSASLTTTMTVVPGDETFTYVHDAEGRLIQVIDPSNQEVTTTWDDNGNVVGETDRANDEGDAVYDDKNNLLESDHPRRGSSSYEYDSANRLVSYTAHGMTTTYTYDGSLRIPSTVSIDGELRMSRVLSADGLVLSATDSDGVTVDFEYSPLRQVTAIIDGLGNRTEFEYDGAGNRTLTRSPLGNVTRWGYDANNRLVSATNALGDTSTWSYDDAGRVSSVTDRRGFSTTYTYDDDGYRASMTDPRNNTTSYGYDWDERSMSTIRPGGATSIVDHGLMWRVESYTDPEGRTTTTSYDSSGRPIASVAPDGTVNGVVYGPGGEVASRTDAAGRDTSYTYDDFGRVVRIDHPGGEFELMEYDVRSRVVAATSSVRGRTEMVYSNADRLVSVTNAEGLTTTYTYDAVGRVSQSTTPDGTAVMEYDADSRLTATVSQSGERVEMTYDAVGRMLSTTDPDGVALQTTYDESGQITSIRRGADAPVTLTYDGVGLVSVTDQAGGTTAYSYDGRNNRTGLTDQAGNTWTFGYNLADQPTSVTDPLDRTTTFTYDGNGRLAATADPSGRVTANVYDAQTGELVVMTTAETSTSYTYDAAGRVDSVSTPDGSVEWLYNSDGLPVSVTEPDGSVTQYEWDAAGNRTATITPSGERIEIDRNIYGQASAITSSGGTISYDYDEDQRPVSATFSDGHARSYTYEDGRLTAYGDGADNWSLSYDASARLSSIDGADSASYEYGTDGTLLSATVNGASFGYGLDSVGNIVSSTTDGMARSFGHDAANQITSVNGVATAHDAAGRVVEWTDADGTRREYVYDDFGRLETATYVTVTEGDGPGAPEPPLELCANPTIVGTDSADRLRGTRGDDVIVTGAGDDVVDGRGGNDIVCALSGNNVIRTGNGRDVVIAGAGDDTVVSGNGVDQVFAGDGTNNVSSGNGDDLVVTGSGADSIESGRGDDVVFGGAGPDVIDADRGDDVVDGGPGADVVDGGRGDDSCVDVEAVTDCVLSASSGAGQAVEVVEVWGRSYTPDGLLDTVTQTLPDGSVNVWELVWDRLAGVPTPLEITENGVTRVFVNGDRPEGVLSGGAFEVLDRNAFGDIGVALGDPFGSGAERGVRLGYRGMLQVGDELYTAHRDFSPLLGRFLSPDPLGHIGAGTPRVSTLYAYAANDPVNFVDPTGLSPSDASFNIFADCNLDDVACIGLNAAQIPVEIGLGAIDFVLDEVSGWWETAKLAVRYGKCANPVGAVTNCGPELIEAGTQVSAFIREHGWGALKEIGEGLLPDACRDAYTPRCHGYISAGIGVEVGLGVLTGGGATAARASGKFARLFAKIQDYIPSRVDDAVPDPPPPAGSPNVRCKSFGADTQVLMADGTTSRIADINVGDFVWAADPEANVFGGRAVTAIWPHEDTLVEFAIGDGTVVTTEDHHFWNSTDREWQESHHVDQGDLLLTAEGSVVEAGALDWSTLHHADAYDLTVAGLHSFFVQADDQFVLVHNTDLPCGPGCDGTCEPAPVRVFTSTDPLVGDVANAIEARYPGHVIDVNVSVRRPDGSDLTDFDIELPNAIIQVKSGRGKGAASQATSTIDAPATAGRPVIVYGPELGLHVVRDIEARGGLVTRSLDELLDVIGP